MSLFLRNPVSTQIIRVVDLQVAVGDIVVGLSRILYVKYVYIAVNGGDYLVFYAYQYIKCSIDITFREISDTTIAAELRLRIKTGCLNYQTMKFFCGCTKNFLLQ